MSPPGSRGTWRKAYGRCGPPCAAPTASSRCTTLAYPPARPFDLLPPARVPPRGSRSLHPGIQPPVLPSACPSCPISLQATPSPSPIPVSALRQPHRLPTPLCPQLLRPVPVPMPAHALLSSTHIPLSGRNPVLQEVLGIRPHVLVLNKMDLADPRQQPTVLEHLKQQGCLHVVFTDCQRDSNVKKIVPLVAKLVGDSPRYHRAESNEYNILVIGVPNVGKSSLINSLRRLHLKKGKATAVGGEPGVTKAVLTKIQVCEQPLMYLVDTPGVLPPKLGDVETGMKLALCGEGEAAPGGELPKHGSDPRLGPVPQSLLLAAPQPGARGACGGQGQGWGQRGLDPFFPGAIRDHLVGEDIMADYLLYALNKRQQFRYVQRYGLAEACDDIEPVLRHVALAQGRTQKVKVLTGTGNVNVTMLNYPAAAYEFLRDFRAGCLGRVTLD
ncbi:mitochondrial ribosome-associated GTPase 1 isoform X2 [Grus americana]|uniref:mitochondrial ribosome-associated GTPase 1 isoform X2 n=1 Tax=Grus americana TaxID=9117 RepID=UPI0024085822|nr:mitochondrial ribosome-associated GTPase 1 isoform X2 [Grus americana]